MNARTELETQTFVVVFVRHCVLRVVIAGINEIDGGLVVERGEVFAAVIVVLLNKLRTSLDHMFHSCFFLLFATGLLSLLGVCRISAVCCRGNNVLIS